MTGRPRPQCRQAGHALNSNYPFHGSSMRLEATMTQEPTARNAALPVPMSAEQRDAFVLSRSS
jgi:hypothetical protein